MRRTSAAGARKRKARPKPLLSELYRKICCALAFIVMRTIRGVYSFATYLRACAADGAKLLSKPGSIATIFPALAVGGVPVP